MKFLTIILSFMMIVSPVMASYVPTTIKGQADAVRNTNFNIEVPNKQATKVTGAYLLNDCGSSNNLLENCGFEHSTPATSWTLTNGSSAVETSNVKQGKQSLKLTLTAQALDFYQTSTLNATAFADGVNGSISLAVKTTVDNVYLCRTDSAGSLVASTDGTKITNCVKVSNSGKWGEYVLPVILGGTSNGITVVSLNPATAASLVVTGTVDVDAAILEAGLKATSQGVCTTPSCETEFGAKVSSSTISSENADWLSSCSQSGSSPYATTCTINPGVFSIAPVCTLAGQSSFDNSMDSSSRISTISTTSIVIAHTFNNVVTSGLETHITCQKQGIDFTNAKALASGRFYTVPSDSFSTDTNTLSFSGTAISTSSPIGTYNTYSYAINSNTKSICTAGNPPSILPNAADGFKIFTRAYNAASTCGNPARVEIKIGAAGTKFPTLERSIYKNTAKGVSGSLEASGPISGEVGARINSYDETTGVLNIDLGFRDGSNTSANISFSDATYATSGFLVINAQKMKDSIVGSFSEVVTSQGATSPDIQSVYFGSSADCSTACTTGNCTICNQVGNKITSVSFVSTGTYRFNGIDGTKYVCDGSANSASGISASFRNRSTQNASYAELQYYVDAALLNASAATATCVGTK